MTPHAAYSIFPGCSKWPPSVATGTTWTSRYGTPSHFTCTKLSCPSSFSTWFWKRAGARKFSFCWLPTRCFGGVECIDLDDWTSGFIGTADRSTSGTSGISAPWLSILVSVCLLASVSSFYPSFVWRRSTSGWGRIITTRPKWSLPRSLMLRLHRKVSGSVTSWPRPQK